MNTKLKNLLMILGLAGAGAAYGASQTHGEAVQDFSDAGYNIDTTYALVDSGDGVAGPLRGAQADSNSMAYNEVVFFDATGGLSAQDSTEIEDYLRHAPNSVVIAVRGPETEKVFKRSSGSTARCDVDHAGTAYTHSDEAVNWAEGASSPINTSMYVPDPKKQEGSLELIVTPNPTNSKGRLNISGNYNGLATVDIYDLLGRKVQSGNVGLVAGQEVGYDIKELPESGKYFARVSAGNESITKPVNYLK